MTDARGAPVDVEPRQKRWGRWWDRLIAMRDNRGDSPVVSELATEICNLEDEIDRLRQAKEALEAAYQAEIRAHEGAKQQRDEQIARLERRAAEVILERDALRQAKDRKSGASFEGLEC